MTNSSGTGWGSGGLFGNRALGSLFLICGTPVFCLTFIYTCLHHNGSLVSVWKELSSVGVFSFISKVFPTPFDSYAWKIIFSFMIFELILVRIIPGKEFRATVTATGHVPIYTANGFQCYLVTILSLFSLAYLGIFNPADVYDNMDKIVSSLNFFAIFFCVFLTIKGLNFPSTKDSGSNGSLIVDYFWGTELYPRIFGWDVKQCTNCRFGMMFWQVAILSYGFKQYQLMGGEISSSIFVSIVLQTIYIAKFFFWETGYFCSMDIQHDRAGYYICWGCLVWVPSMYTIHTFFMVQHPIPLSVPVTLFCLIGGIFCIWCNWDCDRYDFHFVFFLSLSLSLSLSLCCRLAFNVNDSATPMEKKRFGDVHQHLLKENILQKMVKNALPYY
jgi:7-dehydrocholesterol reductase